MTNTGRQDPPDTEPRPPKRYRGFRDVDDNLRPYTIPVSGPSGLHSEPDGGAEGGGKKARKRPLSCGECRRLKLKCDRVFPCQSCCKRGCAEICPDGALTGGKGSRFILANTEQLHDKIKSMSERIRLLEEALRAVQSQISRDEHPLLRQELLLIKKSPELFGVDHHQPLVPARSPDNQRRDEEPPAAASSNSSREGTDERCLVPSSSSAAQVEDESYAFPNSLAKLSRSFPSPLSMSYELDPNMRQSIRDMLPPRSEAQHLCELAQVNAFWQYNPDASETFLPNLIHSVYTTPLSELLPHRLGLFLMVLAIGSRLDLKQSQQERHAEKYHHLARAALCEVPVMDDTSIDAVHALFCMEWYLLMFSEEKKTVEYAWGIMGLMTKLAHTIGLHRDGVRSKVIPEELDKRRALFWDLMSIDTRLALMLRRPPSLSLRHVDAKQPTYSNDGTVATPGSRYHEWQHTFHLQSLLPVLEMVTSPQPPSYSELIGLDSRIRDFEVPSMLRMMDGAAPVHPLGFQQAMTSCTREIALLQLHRTYFTHALNAPEGFTVKHKYAPSVLAVYTSSMNLIWTVYTMYRWNPELTTRFSGFWSNCFSAAVALCFFIAQAPSNALSPSALQEVDKVLRLFRDARDRCPTAARTLPSLLILSERSRSNYTYWRNGKGVAFCDKDDEICVLAMKTGILASPNSVPMAVDGLDADPFENAHPTLVRCFEQATAEQPCDDGLMRIRGPMSSSSGDSVLGLSGSSVGLSGFGSEIQESTWMTWF